MGMLLAEVGGWEALAARTRWGRRQAEAVDDGAEGSTERLAPD